MQQKKGPGSGILKRSRKTFVPSRLYLRHPDTAWHIADGHWLNLNAWPPKIAPCCILGCHTYWEDCRWVREISHFFLMKSLSGSTLTGITNLPWPRCRLLLIKSSKTRKLIQESPWGIAGYSESPHSHLSTSSHFPRNWRGLAGFSAEAGPRCVFNGEYWILQCHRRQPRMLLKLPYTGGELVNGDQWRRILDSHFPRHFRRINNRVSIARMKNSRGKNSLFSFGKWNGRLTTS